MTADATKSTTPLWLPWASSWARVSEHLARSVIEANRATAAAFGLAGPAESGQPLESPLDMIAYREADWEFEATSDPHGDLEVGDRVRFTKRLTDADVRDFARASGDTNLLHLDEAFAEETRFGTRIAHGTLIAGLISAALARLPHLTIYLSQDLEFLRPVEIGDTVSAICEVVEVLGGDRFRLRTRVEDAEGHLIVDGEAVVLIDELPRTDGA